MQNLLNLHFYYFLILSQPANSELWFSLKVVTSLVKIQVFYDREEVIKLFLNIGNERSTLDIYVNGLYLIIGYAMIFPS